MSFEFVKKLPAPNEIKRDFPVPERIARLKAQRDAAWASPSWRALWIV